MTETDANLILQYVTKMTKNVDKCTLDCTEDDGYYLILICCPTGTINIKLKKRR